MSRVVGSRPKALPAHCKRCDSSLPLGGWDPWDELIPGVLFYSILFYGLSSNGIGLYAGKILDLEIIHLIPWRTIGLRKLKVVELRYE